MKISKQQIFVQAHIAIKQSKENYRTAFGKWLKFAYGIAKILVDRVANLSGDEVLLNTPVGLGSFGLEVAKFAFKYEGFSYYSIKCLHGDFYKIVEYSTGQSINEIPQQSIDDAVTDAILILSKSGDTIKQIIKDKKVLNEPIEDKRAEYSLQGFGELAYRAFYWVSFNPRERGQRTINEHENELKADIEAMPAHETERYANNYKKYFSAWLSAYSNCASSAITGGSGFNVRRANKANDRERAKYQEFVEWREKAQKAINKRIEQAKPESQKHAEEWEYLRKNILSSAVTINNINKGIERGYNKALFVANMYSKVEVYANRGNMEIVKNAIDTIRQFNSTKGVVITERHKFFSLLSVAEAQHAKTLANQSRENGEKLFKGGKVIQNWAENRIQILFDEKPVNDIIVLLKQKAFKWSPKAGAWQRQNTNNTLYAVNEIIKVLEAK